MEFSTHMKHSSSFTSMFVFICISLLLCGSNAVVQLPPGVTVPAVIFFGDSIVDQGNNNNLKSIVRANFVPYGKDLNGGKPTGRFSNARTPADLIAESLGIKELVKANRDPTLEDADLITGVSFASGASGYDPQTPKIAGVIPLSTQLQDFKEYIEKLKKLVGEERTSFILANSVFLVVAGSDDLANTYFTIGIRRLEYDVDSYTSLMVSYASQFIQEIYQLGARRIGLFGTPPIGCLPSQRTLSGERLKDKDGCSQKYNEASMMYNSKLSSELSSLQSRLLGSRVVFVDIYNPLLSLIKNPQSYGFEVVDKGCCGTGDIEVSILCNKLLPTCADDTKYIFWDSYHPTETGYRILTDRLLEENINKFF